MAIARALAPRPALVLADEPTASLDKESGRTVLNLFAELVTEKQAAIILVTHDQRVLDLADRVVHTVDGKVA